MSADVLLRRASLTDADLLFRMRTDPETVKYSPGPPPTWDQHLRWMREAMKENGRRLFVANVDGADIGTGRLDAQGQSVVFSITIAPEHRGAGYAGPLIVALLAYARQWWPGCRYVAEVQAENAPSLCAFLRAGFRLSMKGLLQLERL